MKKQFLVMLAALFITMGSAFAQGQQRMSIDERVKIALDKIDASLKPEASVRASVKTILVDYYTNQQKAMEEIRSRSERPDREEIMKIRQQLSDDRDAKLKNVFSAEQFTKWKEEIEPGLRPQRPGGEKKEK